MHVTPKAVVTNVQTFRDYALHQWDVRYELLRKKLKNEHPADEGYSPETSGHLLRFWHFHKHSSCTSEDV